MPGPIESTEKTGKRFIQKIADFLFFKDPSQNCNFAGDNQNQHMHLPNKQVSTLCKAACFCSISIYTRS